MKPKIIAADPESKLDLQGVHVDLTPALHAAMREKFTVILRHDPRIVRLHVRLHRDQEMGSENHYTAIARIEIRGPDLVATADGKEAYDVLDRLADKLNRQLMRRQGRRKAQRNHPHGTEIEAQIPKTDR